MPVRDPILQSMLAERANGSIYASQYAEPAKAAEANRIARKLGLDPTLIEADMPSMVAEERLRRATGIASHNPGYALMMSNQRFAAAAIDDKAVAPLADAAKQLREGAEKPQNNRPQFSDRLRKFGPVGAVLRSLRDTVWSGVSAGSSGLYGLGEAVAEMPDPLGMLGLESEASRRLRTENNVVAGFFRHGRQVTQQSREASSVKYDNWYVDQAARGLESVPTQITALLAAGSGNPVAGLALLSGISGGQSYGEARDKGLSPERSFAYGATQAGAEAVGEMLPILRYADDALKGSGFMKRLGGQLVTENIGEQVTGHLQDFNTWTTLEANEGKTFEDFLNERPGAALAIAVSTTAAVGAQTSGAYAIERTAKRFSERQADTQGLSFLDRFMGAAAKVETRKASPHEFQEVLSQQLDGTPAENIYVSAETVRSLFQSDAELDEDAFWGVYSGPIREAAALGAEVAIPTAEAATHLAGTPQWDQIKEHVRLSMGGSTLAELADANAAFDDASRETGEQLAALLSQDRDAAEPVEKVYEAMRDKLMLAGHTPDTASAMAIQFAQRSRVRAERLGKDLTGSEADTVDVQRVLPEKLASAIRAAPVPDEGLKAVIEEMRRKRNPRTDKAKFGPSLIDWIRSKGGIEDRGGDLKSRDIAPLKGKAKKGAVKLIRPHSDAGGLIAPSGQANVNSPDEMALRAWEAGYFPEFGERPDVNALLDAIDDELRGNARYASDTTTDDDVTREAAQELMALLDQQGLDPEKASPREIAQAVQRYQEQAAQGRGFDQGDGLFDDPAQPQRSMTQAQRAELEARQKQSMARRGGQQALSDQEGGLFSAERDQRSLFQGKAVASISGEEIAPLSAPVAELRAAARGWYDANLKGKPVVSQALGREVKFTNPKKAFNASADPIKIRAFAALRELIANAPLIESRPPLDQAKEPTTRAYHYLEAVVEIAGDPHFVGVMIREDANGDLYYNHRIQEGASPGPLGTGSKASPGTEGRALDQSIPEDAENLNLTIRSVDQSYEDGARGRITFQPDGTSVISLFAASDMSTFLHESGHLYLEQLKADAAEALQVDTEQARQLATDWDAVQVWFKANGFEVGPDGTIPTEAHEMWARGFERYLMEGKAPSSTLRRAFEAFRSWLLTIYKVVDNLRSPVTPEIRDVMARLMATDEEIEAAAAEQQIKALFNTAEEAGMTEQEFSDYRKAAQEARDEAFDALLYRTMAPIRAARTKEHKEREAVVRAEVMAEVDGQPLYRALRIMRSGEDGSPVKLSTQWLVDTYGADILAELPGSVPPLHSKDGVEADVIADLAGFTSGDEMVKFLLGYSDAKASLKEQGDKRSPRQAAIDEMTAEVMAERYGDPLRDGSIETEARALIHSEKQGEIIASEVRALGRRSGNKPTPYAIARRWAREKIQSGQVSEVISGAALLKYQRAARKAAQEAEKAMLAGDVDEAFRQKQKQMLNNALVSEGQKAKDAVDGAVKRLSKTARRQTAKSIAQDYLDQAHTLLEGVEFRPRTQRDLSRQQAFEEWAAEQRANGIDVTAQPGFAASIGQRHWSRLSVEQIVGLDDTVKQILHLGRLKQTLLDGQERRARDEVIAEMRATAAGVGKGPPSSLNDPGRSFIEGARSKLRGADAAMIKIEQLVDWLDQGKANGVFNRMIFKPLADAQGREADMMRDYVSRMNELVDNMPKKQLRDWRRRVDTPELINRIEDHPLQGEPWSFYKDQIVMMALNWGNEGNRQRLLDGYGWSEAQVQAVLDRFMTAEDWAFVQSTWDTINGLWPQIEELEKRVNGVAPPKVEAISIETPHGTFSGGYFPAIYDQQWSSRTSDQETEGLLEGGYVRANVRSSASQARAEKVKRPLLLNMSVITRHLGEVIHDITHREALTDTWRLVSDERVQRVVTNALGSEYAALLKPWLRHIANDQARNASSNSMVIGLLRGVGQRITVVGLGYRFMSSAAQIAGMPNIIAQIGERRMIEGWGRFLANPLSAYREVTEKSAEMRDRFSTMDRDLVERAQQASKSRGIHAITGPGWFTKYAFHGILIMDSILTTAGWIGAYRKAAAEGMPEDEAIYYADKIVRKSQGAGGAKDQAAITREHEAVKLFVKFFSYFSALYNQQRDFGHRLRRVSGAKELGKVMHFGFWAMVVPPLLDAIIRGEGPGDDEDDESTGAWAAQRLVFGNLGSIPGVRDIGGAIDNGFGYKATPVNNIGDSFIQNWGNLQKSMEGEEPSSKWVKQALTFVGIAANKPTGQLASTAQFGYDVAQGEAEPETAGQWFEGATKGQITEEAN